MDNLLVAYMKFCILPTEKFFLSNYSPSTSPYISGTAAPTGLMRGSQENPLVAIFVHFGDIDYCGHSSS